MFQERLDRVLKSFSSTGIADDVLCHGNAEIPHDAAVITLLETARANNLTLKAEKFVFKSQALLNSSLMMSLGAGALKISRGPNAISREVVSMATLEAGTTPRAATNRHCHTE